MVKRDRLDGHARLSVRPRCRRLRVARLNGDDRNQHGQPTVLHSPPPGASQITVTVGSAVLRTAALCPGATVIETFFTTGRVDVRGGRASGCFARSTMASTSAAAIGNAVT